MRGHVLPVNEVFASIQGEGIHAGTPSLFIRLQACPVGCPWCDTKHTWMLNPGDARGAPVILSKGAEPDSTYAWMSVDELVTHALDWRASRDFSFDATRYGGRTHVVLTGGEPALYDLEPLSAALIDERFEVQLETSGTQPIRIDWRAWVTVSPKLDMPGGFAFLPEALSRADEIKHPIGKRADVDALKGLLASMTRKRPPVFVQPLSESAKATALCIEAASDNGWRVSVQVHKVIGVR